jgi:hypothetical protein
MPAVPAPPAPATTKKTCDACGGANTHCNTCSKCRDSFYCSVNCQHAAWTSHKQECIDPQRVADMKKIAAQFTADCAGGDVPLNTFRKAHDMLFSQGSYMTGSSAHDPKATVFFLRKQKGLLKLLTFLEFNFNTHTSAPADEANRLVTLRLNSGTIAGSGTLLLEQARAMGRHLSYIMEHSKLSRLVLEILAHSALVTSIDEAAAGAAGAAGAEAMPTPPPTTVPSTTAEETATEAILVLSRILTSTFADPSLHPLLYSWVGLLELQAVRLNVGLNVYKAVLRATGIDLTDKTDERTEDYLLAKMFAKQAIEKSGVYTAAARNRLFAAEQDKVFVTTPANR